MRCTIFRALGSKLEQASESPGGLGTHGLLRPAPEFLMTDKLPRRRTHLENAGLDRCLAQLTGLPGPPNRSSVLGLRERLGSVAQKSRGWMPQNKGPREARTRSARQSPDPHHTAFRACTHTSCFSHEVGTASLPDEETGTKKPGLTSDPGPSW